MWVEQGGSFAGRLSTWAHARCPGSPSTLASSRGSALGLIHWEGTAGRGGREGQWRAVGTSSGRGCPCTGGTPSTAASRVRGRMLRAAPVWGCTQGREGGLGQQSVRGHDTPADTRRLLSTCHRAFQVKPVAALPWAALHTLEDRSPGQTRSPPKSAQAWPAPHPHPQQLQSGSLPSCLGPAHLSPAHLAVPGGRRGLPAPGPSRGHGCGCSGPTAPFRPLACGCTVTLNAGCVSDCAHPTPPTVWHPPRGCPLCWLRGASVTLAVF